MKSLKTLSSALEGAMRINYEKITIPKLYLYALQDAQVFEQQLHFMYSGFVYVTKKSLEKDNLYYNPEYKKDWTYKDLVNRIKVFLPESENKDFYNSLEKAKETRNKFIHECFKVETGLVNLSLEDFYLHKNSQKILNDWIDSYNKANIEITNIFNKYLKNARFKIQT